jgi:hypothetical protein
MSHDPESAVPILYDEAGDLTKKIDDERLRAFVNYGLTTVLVRRGMDPQVTLTADFDLRFFAEALRAMGENRAMLLRIFEGELSEGEWWPDNT